MKINNINKLTIKYNNEIVGYLVQLDEENIAFQYNDAWIEKGFSISPFSLPLSDKVYINRKRNFDGLYGVFRDCLPDGWGILLTIRALQKIGVDYNKLLPLTKLSLINESGLGGLSFEPFNQIEEKNINIDLDLLSKSAKEIYEGSNINQDFDTIYKLGGSSGGARPKIHLKIGEEWRIIKFPTRYDGNNIGIEEYNANNLAKKCGINVNEFKIFDSNICQGYFASKRFDRLGNKRVHVISLSSLLETTHTIPNLDYIHLFEVINAICIDKEENIKEAYKRMCFNVLYGNKDDHGKNFSFLYDEIKKGYVLSPAYDLTKTPFKLEHEMSVNGNGKPEIKDLKDVGKIIKLANRYCNDVIENILKIINNR